MRPRTEFESTLRLARESGNDAAEGMFERTQRSLIRIRDQVSGSNDFESPTAKSELLEEINGEITRLRRAWARHHAGGQIDDAPTVLNEDAEARLWAERVLQANKNQELPRLADMRANLHDMFGSMSEVYHEGSRLHNLYVTWYRQADGLRGLYGGAGIAPSEWKVSEGPFQTTHQPNRQDPRLTQPVQARFHTGCSRRPTPSRRRLPRTNLLLGFVRAELGL